MRRSSSGRARTTASCGRARPPTCSYPRRRPPGSPSPIRSYHRGMPATIDDRVAVRALLGREPLADFEVVAGGQHGAPVVIRNAPFTIDGTPMPTRYWLVDPEWNRAVS